VDVFTDLLKQNLPEVHKARLRAVALFVLSLISEATVNLQKLALSGLVAVKPDSMCKRFSRLLIWVAAVKIDFGGLILKLMPPCPEDKFILCMDRTNWKYGKKHINFLVLSIYFNGVGYPLVWRLLPRRIKRGNSDTSHRTALMRKALKLLKPTQIKCLLMDREFIGEEWLGWLNGQHIPYIARIKDNALVNANLPVTRYRKTLSRKKLMRAKVNIYGQDVYLSHKRITGKDRRSEHLFTISNQLQSEWMLELYAKRWSIEQMFSHWKKRGFDFESTHITHSKRLMGLMALLALAYVIVHQWGSRLNNLCAIKRKKHGSLAKSIFRYGLDHLRNVMRRLSQTQRTVADILKFIFTKGCFVR
jgi:hypothetical protein